MSKRFIRVYCLFALLFLFLSVYAEDDARHKITVQLQWRHQFEFAGHYAAIAQGFYAQRGLDVDLREYRQGMDVVDEVLSGRAQFGVYHSDVIRARLEGKPVVLLANYFKRMPMVILTRPDIHSLGDLKGKRLMVADKDTRSPLFRLAFAQEDLRIGDNITVVPHTFNVTPLLNGDVDAMTAFITNEPFYLTQQNFTFNRIELANYMRSLGDEYVFTSEHLARQNPAMIKDFIAATTAGWRYALAHKGEIVDLIRAEYSREKTRAALLYEAEKTHDMVLPLPLPIGEVYPDVIKDVANLIMQQQGIENEAYLDGFLFDFTAPRQTKVTLTAKEQAWLDAHPSIVFGTDERWRPYVEVLEDGSVRGVEADLLARIKALTGANIHLVLGAWSKMITRAEQGELDGLAVAARHPQRAQQFLFSLSPYSEYKYIFTANSGAQKHPWTDMASLAGRRVGLLLGRLADEALLQNWPDITPVYLASNQALATALLNGDVDAVLNNINFYLLVREHMLDNIHLAFPVPNSEVKLGYAVNKNDPELLSIINKALKAIPTTEIGDILTNWGANPDIHANANHLNPTEQHWLSTHRRLKYCFNPHKKPYDYIEDGAHQGIFADYLALFGDKLNIHWQAVPTANWNDAVEAARQRHCDVISGAIKTPELEQFFDFSTPYFEITPVLLAKANKPFVKGIEEVRAHPIGVLRNSPLEALLRRDFPEMHLIAVEAEHITDLLESGEVYAFVTSLEHAARHIDEKLYNYRIIAKLDYSQPISLAIRNDWPLLRAILDKAVRTVTQAEHNTIKAKWTTHRLTQRVDYSLLFQVVGGAMLILLFVMISNRRMAREIQQRIQVEEQLRKLSRAVEQSHSTIVITDLDGTIEFVNPAFTRITGYTQAEVIGQNPRILQSGEHALPFYQNMWATLTQGEVWQGELHNKRKNGDMYWEFATISSIKNQAGEITHYVAIKEDISARREAEAKVRESTERLQKIAARVPGLVFQFEMRADGSIAFPYASEAMRDIYGVDPDSVKKDATPVIDNIHPADREEVMVSIQRSAETLMPWQQEYRILFADGRQRWLLGNSVPERRQDGCVLWHGFITDITERKKAEQNLRENEAKLRNLYELSPLGIALTDIQGRFLEFNNAFVDICGCSAEELEKLNYWTLIQQDEDAAQTSMQLQTLQSQGRCGPYEKTYTRKDGAQVPVRLNAMLMSSQDGSAYIWTLLEDIRAQKQHEAELQQARDAAEAANYAKSAFLANMSHELRTPLNAILGFAQILHQLDDLKPEYRSHVDNIHRGGQYLLTLINDVLDLAKVEAGYIELYPQEVIIDTFFRDLLEMFRLRAEKKNIRFEFIASQPLPFSMTIDPKRLRQVLINLLGNAMKFTEHGFVRLQIEAANQQFAFQICDSGPGIAEDKYEEIFQAFAQTGENRYKTQGTGLGLSICRKIIDLMGGDIDVRSKLNQGSCFSVRIPVSLKYAEASSPALQSPPSQICTYQRTQGDGALRILITDDISNNRLVLRYILEPLGFEIAEADSGEACIDKVPEFQPDLILMDLRMPRMNGLETTQKVHQLPGYANLPVIVVSASAFAEDKQISHAAGCVAHIAKPLQQEQLLAYLQKHLPLRWVYAEQSAHANHINSTLTAAQCEQLLVFSQRGAIGEMLKYLQQLAQNAESSDEIEHLLELAKKFEMNAIKTYLEHRMV